MLKVAIANLKGGVGKSTATLFLAETLAVQNDQRVLVIDLDPQSSSSFMMLSREGVEAAEANGRTLPHFLLDRPSDGKPRLHRFIVGKASEIRELRQKTGGGRVDIIPSIPKLWFVELLREKRHYIEGREPAQELQEMLTSHLDELKAEYDVVLFDCPPGFSSLSQAGLLSADAIISPTIADGVSIRSLGDFATIGLGDVLKLAKKPHFVIISKLQANETNRQEKARLAKKYVVLEPAIRYSVDMTRATERVRAHSVRSLREKYDSLEADIRKLGAEVYRAVVAR